MRPGRLALAELAGFLLFLCWLAFAHPAEGSRLVERTSGPAASWANPVNRNLLRVARCETGYLRGGRPNWRHHNGTYTGGLGFAHSTWTYYKQFVRPVPRALWARDATVAQQLAVGRVLVSRFGWSPWPACSVRLGLRRG